MKPDARRWNGPHREGRNHTLYRLGATMIPIPRHTELDDRFAELVFQECESELGERWWRR